MGLCTVVAVDFTGCDYEEAIRRDLKQDEHVDEIIDVDVKDGGKTPYPHVGVAGARLIAEGKADHGIFCCGTGMGTAISTNKVPGIRASTTHGDFSVEQLILSNDAHVLCLGQRVIGLELIRRLIREFLDYEFDPSPYSKADVGVLVECGNGLAGCWNCFRRLSKGKGLEELARLPLSGITDHT